MNVHDGWRRLKAGYPVYAKYNSQPWHYRVVYIEDKYARRVEACSLRHPRLQHAIIEEALTSVIMTFAGAVCVA